MIILATEHKYCDNNGPYSIAHTWDGEKVSSFSYANGYDGLIESSHTANATEKQFAEAVEWYVNNAENKGWSYHSQSNIPIGCIVKLKRCRKAANKTDLEVLDWSASYYDGGGFYHPEQIKVNGKNGSHVWVSANCIDSYTKGLKPDWA